MAEVGEAQEIAPALASHRHYVEPLSVPMGAQMDIDKSLGRLAVMVPVVHVVACSLFLVGYSWGFESGVATLFTASDFFTVSLDHLVRMYALGMAFPLALLVYQHRSGAPYIADAIAVEVDETKKNALVRQSVFMKTLIISRLFCLLCRLV
jgi:hypothetical protein